jgi:plastocyanin
MTGAILGFLLLLSLVAPPGTFASNTVTVDVRDNFFIPSAIKIAPGDSVTWVWKGQNDHTTTSDVVPAGAANWTSPDQGSGTFGPLLFKVSGYYHYYCVVHGQSMSGTISVQTLQVPTYTTLTSSANPSILGQPVALEATVTSGAGTPTGTVAFKDGSTALGSMTLDSQGHAIFTTSTLSVGTHSIVAAYQGSQTFLASASTTLAQVVNKATPTVSLTSSPNPSVVGGPVALSINVSSGVGVPSGSVALTEGASALANITLDANGNGAFTTSSLPVGNLLITASYSGDANFVAASAMLGQVVNRAPSAMVVAPSMNPVLVGNMVTFTATVSSSSGGTPTGMVTFQEGTATLGAPSLTAGTAILTTTFSVTGVHIIQATYSGDANHTGTADQSVQLVSAAGSAQTTATITAKQGGFRKSATITAKVASSGLPIPTGEVVLVVDGDVWAITAQLDVTGQAVIVTELPPSEHGVTVIYLGDGTYAAATSNGLNVITPVAPRNNGR